MDVTQFEKLVNDHKDSVYRQMLRVCNNREDAEDALADALLAAYRSLEKLESTDAFRAWLGTIGRRICLRMKSRPAVKVVLEEMGDLVDTDASEDFDAGIMKQCVRDAVDTLSATHREVYMQCELEEKSVPEVANALGLSTAAVKSRLLRARAHMREKLDASVCGS